MGLSLASKGCLSESAQSKTRNPKSEIASKLRYFGDYELLEEIARGGMGVVYRARQVSLNRIVAVKMLLFGKFSSDEFVKRFQTEAQAVASLRHPNIVAIHEIGEHEGQHYFSMDFIEGKSLTEFVRDSPLSAQQAAGYIKTIAEAIHHAHQRGILHRDLKPSNVLIDELDQPRVTDFGLAKQLKGDAELTATGQMLGSPNYMPPEQADTKRGALGPNSDVYSLGAILYHLLTGRPPFLAETLEATLRQLMDSEPVPPRWLNASVPRDLETICLKCLEKSPRKRYPTAQALADELARYLRGEPIAARPVNRAERAWRWCRREPAIASLLAGLIVVFWFGFGSVLFEWRRAEKHQRLAEAKTEMVRTFRYANDMNLALRAWEDGSRIQAASLVAEHRPKAGETDLRGFEWRHLWWRCRGDYESFLPAHEQIVGSMMFSPDGERLATFAWDDTLRVWNLASPQKPLLVITNVTALGGFVGGGAEFVVGQRNGTIIRCHPGTGAMVGCLTNAGELVAMAANGNTVVSFDKSSQLNAWDLTNRQWLFQVPGVIRRRLDYGWGSGIAIAPAGNILAVVKQSTNSLRPDLGIQLWEVQTRRELRFLPVNREIRSLQFSPDGRTLAVGDGDGVIWRWDMATFESVTNRAHEQPVLSLAFSPDGQTLASGGSDECIKLWNLAAQTQTRRTFRGQLGAVWSLVFSPDGRRLASGSRDATIKIWEVAVTKAAPPITNVLSHDWGNFAFSPDSKLMAAGCKDNTVRVWDVATQEEKAVLHRVSYIVAFSKNGKSLLASTRDEVPEWRDLATQTVKPLPSYHGILEGRVPCVSLSPDRQRVALGFNSGDIQILEIATGRIVATFHAHDGGVGSVMFSPRGDKLVSGGRDKSVAVWEVQTQKKLQSSPEHRGSVCAVAMSSNGSMLASGCNANTIRFWNADDLTQLLPSVSYHESVIRTLCFAPDGKTLASGSEDNTAKLWSVRSHLEVASFKFDDHVRLVSFSPDGNHLAVVTDHGTLTLIHAASLEQADRVAEMFLR